MLHPDSTRKPAAQTPRLVVAISTAFAVAIDMLAMVLFTLFYDGLVGVVIFVVEFSHYSKNGSGRLLADSIGIGWLGIVVGSLGVIFLVARKKYYRVVAALIGLAPLVFFICSASAPR